MNQQARLNRQQTLKYIETSLKARNINYAVNDKVEEIYKFSYKLSDLIKVTFLCTVSNDDSNAIVVMIRKGSFLEAC